jgi:small subunit ribosomal protein S11
MKRAIVRIYSSKNNTIITATDISGAETLSWSSGGRIVDADREEGKPYAAMQAALKVITDLKNKSIEEIIIKLRAPGGNRSKTLGMGANAAVRMFARSGLKIARIEDVNPIPTDTIRRKGGRKGRRV